mmetsp:Transcript_15155/g.32897  ORF Transcript_15155/g.32897 Transcript_15155/m.32897 type:complete len:83 (-) Transcript_15155:45-293(-)
MTAHGYFTQGSSQTSGSRRYFRITHDEHRRKLTDLEHKLYPPGGPAAGDFSEGRGGSSGLVDYGPEDDEADRAMGIHADGDY